MRIVILRAGVLIALLLSIRPSDASPLQSPLPCPPDITLPGSVCWLETKPSASEMQSSARWRVALPLAGR